MGKKRMVVARVRLTNKPKAVITRLAPTRRGVFAVLSAERDFQEALIDASQTRRKKPLESYLLYIEDYAAEMRKQLSRIWGPNAERSALHTLRKITSLGVAAMEEHGAVPRDTVEAVNIIQRIQSNVRGATSENR